MVANPYHLYSEFDLTPGFLEFNYTHLVAVCKFRIQPVLLLKFNTERHSLRTAGLLYYDYSLTLASEVEHVWKSKWGVTTCLYISIRLGFLAQVSLVIVTYLRVSPNVPPIASTPYRSVSPHQVNIQTNPSPDVKLCLAQE